jgi:hypothetical protein
MLQFPPRFNVYEVQAYYITFLGILFTEVRNELSRLLSTRFSTYEDLAKWWRGHLGKGDNRARLYQSITEKQDGIQSNFHFKNGLVVRVSAL